MDGLKAFFDKPRLWLNGLLLGLTVVSAFVVGLGWSLSYIYADRLASDPPLALTAEVLRDPHVLGLSLLYVFILMAVLLAHEFGHYLTCRRFGIDASLPFFIPWPFLIGTMGAFIRIRTPITRRQQLFDIGAAGPLAGFILAVPALAWGLARSRVVPSIPAGDAIVFGEPLLLKAFGAMFFRGIGPNQDIILHPVAFAGWVGILVTALNLLPLGQLDGGHIAYALFGPPVAFRWSSWAPSSSWRSSSGSAGSSGPCSFSSSVYAIPGSWTKASRFRDRGEPWPASSRPSSSCPSSPTRSKATTSSRFSGKLGLEYEIFEGSWVAQVIHRYCGNLVEKQPANRGKPQGYMQI